MSTPSLVEAARERNARWGGRWSSTKPPYEVDGWYIYNGPRPITVSFTDPETGEVQGTEQWHHGLILDVISDLVDHLHKYEPDNALLIAAAEAVFTTVELDLDTGTMICALPEYNRLVDLVLTQATSVEDHVSDLTTEWSVF